MPIPTQNEFLLPFLTILSNGKSVARGQMVTQLSQHFNLSEEDLQEKSGRQKTMVNRIAWCDTHFVKAGFVDKKQHSTDHTKDEFHITPLGVRELDRSAEKLTVGYLQTFYRGKIYRGAGSDDTVSDAELELYDAFEKLPKEFTVFNSIKWFGKTRGSVGEIDFIIAHQKYGVLVLEVKGGQISTERRGNKSVWFSTDYYGHVHDIHDPCEQAERNSRALWDWLAETPGTSAIAYKIFPAVAFPDSRVDRDIRPDCPQDIFIDIRHLDSIEARLLDIYHYWEAHADTKNSVMGGSRAIEALIDLIVPTRQLQPKIADIFERERRKIDELTQTQFRVLSQLRRYKRAAIVGGAGSGKTMLAMEKCQQLANSGFRVLFMCFNAGLAEWVGKQLHNDQIVVSTFHALIPQVRGWAGLSKSSGLNSKDFFEKAPDLLMDALSIIHSPDSGAQQYLFDAIVVDEAQDFEDTWWIALPEALHDPQEGVFYVFFDNNQKLYAQIGNVPLHNEPFYLDENLRNTKHIHEQMIRFARDMEDTICEGPEGRAVEIIPAPTKPALKTELGKVLHRLVNEQGVAPSDIMILTTQSEKSSQWKEGEQIGNFMLTYDTNSTVNNAIRVSSIRRFKGLESAVVVLTELDKIDQPMFQNQLIYVGLSRARNHAIVIGDLPRPLSFDNPLED